MKATGRDKSKMQPRTVLNGRQVPKVSAGVPRSPVGKKKVVRAPEAAIPDEAAVESVIAGLVPADRVVVRRIMTLLTEHLGSPEAARLWLNTTAPEFGVAPLDAIKAGRAGVVLAVLESQWGPNPTYA